MSVASMTPERWAQVRTAADAVRGLGAAARAAKLEELCGGDRALRAEVERLLAVDAYATLTGRTGVGDRTLLYDGSVAGPPEALGQALGRYRLLRLLGQGGMGVVFQADDEQLRRAVAIKMVSGPVANYESTVGRFRDEAMAIARLLHPNVVQVYDWGESETGPYFVMEYVAGGSLAERLKGDRLPPAEAARLVRLMARAVHAAHQRGVVHRDLKPGNVLLAPPSDEPALNFAWGCPKVSDFGLALILDADAGPTGVSGTPAYMSPEQAAGSAQVGPASDVYSLGVVLYELLTGAKPFDGDDVLAKVRTAAPEPPSRRAAVPPALERVCLKCLEKDPAKRYATAAELAEALDGPVARRRFWPWQVKIAVSITITFGCLLFAVALMTDRIGFSGSQRPQVAARKPDPTAPDPPVMTAPKVEPTRSVPPVPMPAPDPPVPPPPKPGPRPIPPKKADPDKSGEAVRIAQAAKDAAAKAEALRIEQEKREAERSAAEAFARMEREKEAERKRREEEARQPRAPMALESLYVLKDHRAAVLAAAFPRDGQLMTTEDRPPPGAEKVSPIIVWDLLGGKKLDSYTWHYDRTPVLAVSPDGNLVASQGGRANQEDLEVWDPVKKRSVFHLFDFPKAVANLTFSADGALLGAVNLEERVTVWSMSATGRQVRKKQAKETIRESNPVTAVVLRADRGLTLAASGHKDGTVRLWSPVSEADFGSIAKLHSLAVKALAFAPDGKRLASVAADGSLRVTEGDKTVAKAESGGGLRCVAWAKDGKRLVTGGDDGLVRVWDAEAGKELFRGTGHEGAVTCVAVAADGRTYASGGEDKTVRIWSAKPD